MQAPIDIDPTAGPNSAPIQARSSGRKPEFFRLPFQFLRSISRWAMFQSPHSRTSRPHARASRWGRKPREEAELGRLPLRRGGARGQIHRDDGQRAEHRLEVASLGIELGNAEALR
jgi:hypothetical protein